MQIDTAATNTLFTQYINIVNQAIGENRDRFPYAQALTAAEKMMGDKSINVAVYDQDPDQPHDYFTIKLDDGTFDLEQHGKGDGDVLWSVPNDHLKEVVDNPEPYLEEPAKLDLDWLQKRVSTVAGNIAEA